VNGERADTKGCGFRGIFLGIPKSRAGCLGDPNALSKLMLNEIGYDSMHDTLVAGGDCRLTGIDVADLFQVLVPHIDTNFNFQFHLVLDEDCRIIHLGAGYQAYIDPRLVEVID